MRVYFFYFFLTCAFLPGSLVAQTAKQGIGQALVRFEADSQMKNASYGLYVVDAVTGEAVVDKNSHIGLATASCLKLVTSATAYELLGAGYKFITRVGGDGKLENGVYEGNIYISGGGDPSLGSWRWPQTSRDSVFKRLVRILRNHGISSINGNIYIEDYSGGFHHVTPGGWTWDDIGNYYGAAARQFNWHENQFDIFFKTGASAGLPVTIKKTDPELPGVVLHNYLKTAARGTGDKSVIYLPPFSGTGYITGTLPAGEDGFKVSGALPNPSLSFALQLRQQLTAAGIKPAGTVQSMLDVYNTEGAVKTAVQDLGIVESPPLDSLNYWFMRRSINLYGEAFVKAVAKQPALVETAAGIKIIKEFWQQRQIPAAWLNIYDGSGLSPQNRVTAKALVAVLKHARTRPWFAGYYNAFPEYNGMKLKSGTIADVKGFAGYHTAKNGRQYIIAFLVNNFSGSASGIVQKMYRVLDQLK